MKLKSHDIVIGLISIFVLVSIGINDALPFYYIVFLLTIYFTYLYPEFAFAVFITTGMVFPTYYTFLGIDKISTSLTLFFLLTFGIILTIYREEEKNNKNNKKINRLYLYLVILIGIILLFQSFRSPSRSYGLSKSLLYFVYNFLFFLIPYKFLIKKDALKKFYTSGSILGIILMLLSFFSIIKYKINIGSRFDPTGEDSIIWFGRMIGLSMIFFHYSLLEKRGILQKLFYFFSIVFTLFFLNLAGARGPFISLVLSFIIYFLIFNKTNIKNKLLYFSLFLIIGYFSITILVPNIIGRFIVLRHDYSSLARIYSAIQSFHYFLKNPLFGWGTGSFSALVNEVIKYPHNIFLELAMETGIIGLIIFIVFVYYFLSKFFHLKKSIDKNEEINLLSISLLIFLFSLFNAQFSGDITHNPLIWFAGGTIAVIDLRNPKDAKN